MNVDHVISNFQMANAIQDDSMRMVFKTWLAEFVKSIGLRPKWNNLSTGPMLIENNRVPLPCQLVYLCDLVVVSERALELRDCGNSSEHLHTQEPWLFQPIFPAYRGNKKWVLPTGAVGFRSSTPYYINGWGWYGANYSGWPIYGNTLTYVTDDEYAHFGDGLCDGTNWYAEINYISCGLDENGDPIIPAIAETAALAFLRYRYINYLYMGGKMRLPDVQAAEEAWIRSRQTVYGNLAMPEPAEYRQAVMHWVTLMPSAPTDRRWTELTRNYSHLMQ